MNSSLREGQQEGTAESSCYVDGSWAGGWRGEMGYVIIKGGFLLKYGASPNKACSLLQAEAGALMEAVEQVTSLGLHSCTFFSDSMTLVQAVSQYQPPIDVDWKAYKEVHQLWTSAKSLKGIGGGYFLTLIGTRM